MSSSLETAGIDTRLARALLEAGRLDHPTLLGALEDVRERRAAGVTLARSLCQRGLLDEAELAGWVQKVAGGEGSGWAVGGRVAGLEILRSLGAGGMGAVHLARDLETGAEVAVKTLTLGEDEELQVRFEREAEAQARVGGHPHVVAVHRSGVAGGRAFLVMDVAPGGDLAARVRAGPLPPREAAEIARSLARGLAHAHACGVLHRDLKPANVLFDDLGAPRLTDFGLARLAGAEDLTQTGQVLGTPAYMAPEQASAGVVDERSDVYGLGAILFATLTGRAPFVGPGVFALLVSVSEGGAPPVRSLNPEVAEGLAAICDRCLAKRPSDRYPSAAALAESLDDFLSGRLERSYRGRLLAGGCLAVTAGLLAGAGVLASREAEVVTVASRTPSRTPVWVAPPPRASRPGDLSRKELRALRTRLGGRGSTPERGDEVDQALARCSVPPPWLLKLARTPFSSFAAPPGAEGVRDLGEGAFLVWTAEETEVYDVWSTKEPRWRFAGRFRARSPDGARALLTKGKRLRLVDLEYGAVLGERLLPQEARRVRFSSEREALVAVNHGEDAELIRVELLARVDPVRLCVVEGLKDFELVGETLIMGWGGEDSDAGGAAARSLSDLGGPDLWRLKSVVDGAPSVLARSPSGERVALGTLAGRLQIVPRGGPEAAGFAELATDAAGIGTRKAQLGRVHRVAWLGPRRLIARGEDLNVWREGSEGWALELELDLGPGLNAFDLSADGRRLLAVAGGRVTQRLLSGYLPQQASRERLFPLSARARVVVAYAMARAELEAKGQAARENDKEQARAGAAFALSALPLSALLREKVRAWAATLGPRRIYEDVAPSGSSEKRGALAEDAGALEKALVGYREDLERRPLDPMAHFRFGRVLRQLGDLGSARRYLDQAEALVGEGPSRAGQLKRYASERRRHEEDQPQVESALKKFGGWAE